MITLTGQLVIETRHGRYGDFNVGQLRTPIGQFAVKDPDLDQYPQGKYDGEFNVVEIRQQTYHTNGRIVFEMRAYLAGMTLSGVDALTQDEARKLSPQEPDPIEQETASTAVPAVLPEPSSVVAESAPVSAAAAEPSPTTSVESAPLESQARETGQEIVNPDSQLFGLLWPLAERFRLDKTVDRRVLRQQVRRLADLDYDIDPKTQEWYRKAA